MSLNDIKIMFKYGQSNDAIGKICLGIKMLRMTAPAPGGGLTWLSLILLLLAKDVWRYLGGNRIESVVAIGIRSCTFATFYS
ncbi:hypothetical protein L6452_37566 [Arctium lappa]|uniref:Uncharacterized protein n=1 Tax=Arctium lappa TaxID=4217 RepID=A0ACB8Y3B0_ARCLA|nr:hypothetical protein L6452_37566 [Arctium lappa]